jgi:hypothetical protein
MAGSNGEERGLRAYARAVETRFRQLGGSARLVSPREFALILDWYERSVPLHLVLGALEEAFSKEEGIGSLGYLRRPVDRLFRSYREARLGGAPEGGAATVTRGELRAFLGRARAAVSRAAAGPAGESLLRIAAGLESLAQEAAAGPEEEGAPGLETMEARLAELDALLLEAARERLGEEECARLAREADERLAPHREVMSEEVYLRTRERHARRLIRRALELPELSLFAL